MTSDDNTIDLIERSSRRYSSGEIEGGKFEVEIPPTLLYFKGHFDGQPLLPAVVQLELLVLPRVEQMWPELQHLIRASRVKFKRPVQPSDLLSLQLERRNATKRVTFTIRRSGETVGSGTLEFA